MLGLRPDCGPSALPGGKGALQRLSRGLGGGGRTIPGHAGGVAWSLGEDLGLLLSQHALRVPGAGESWGCQNREGVPTSMVCSTLCVSQRKGRGLEEIQACLLESQWQSRMSAVSQ